MLTLPRRLAMSLVMTLTALTAQPTKTVVITKCQNCSTNAAKAMQACQTSGGNAGGGCQKAYQKRMAHCNKKFCAPKMTKVKVRN